jgi:uncharacterized protein
VLLEYGFRNFFSFREGGEVKLRLDANCPSNVSLGRDVSTVLVVEGPNAAGKTHALKALSFLARFAAHSFHTEPDAFIAFSSFFDNPDPTEFFVEFSTSAGIEYRYELVLTDRKVIRETVYKTVNRRTVLIEREGNKVRKPKSMVDIPGMILRDNASIISTFNQYGRSELSDVYNFCSRFFSNVGFNGYQNIGLSLARAAALLYDRPKLRAKVLDFIKACDLGVDDIQIERKQKDATGKKEPEFEYDTWFYHKVDGETRALLIESQSNGTQALFRVLGIYFSALTAGSVVIFDEFDTHLHAHLIPKVVELFTDPESNPHGAQLLATCHNDRIMDVVGKYRTVLVSKDNNESYLYRMDELPGDLVRNDRSVLPAYHEGKLGGVPRL